MPPSSRPTPTQSIRSKTIIEMASHTCASARFLTVLFVVGGWERPRGTTGCAMPTSCRILHFGCWMKFLRPDILPGANLPRNGGVFNETPSHVGSFSHPSFRGRPSTQTFAYHLSVSNRGDHVKVGGRQFGSRGMWVHTTRAVPDSIFDRIPDSTG